jgi:MFS family permease
LIATPFTLKVVIGFVSDSFPIFGQRRKPYFILGYLLCVSALASLALLENPSILGLSVLSFVAALGQLIADVMADTMVVERSKLEEEGMRGTFQSACYAIRFTGGLIGSVAGCIIYNKQEWGWGLTFAEINWLCAALPVLPLCLTIPSLYDHVNLEVAPVSQQCRMLYETVQRKAVWLPMTFVFFYNTMQLGNVSWNSYLQLTLGFGNFEIGTLIVMANAMTLAGVLVYRRFFLHTSLLKIYTWTTLVPLVFSFLQLLLIFQINRKMGISDYAFAFGDGVITQLVSSICFLPICIFFAKLCPKGSEGSVYATLTSASNVAQLVSSSLSNVCATIWDVQNSAMRAHDVRGLWKLTVLTSLACCVPLPFMRCCLLPPHKQRELETKGEVSVFAGTLFLVVLFGSILLTLIQSGMEIASSSR